MTKDAPLEERIAAVKLALHKALLLAEELEVDVFSADDPYIGVHEIESFEFRQMESDSTVPEQEPDDW